MSATDRFPIDRLLKHVGCGSVDNIHSCILCEMIRARLKRSELPPDDHLDLYVPGEYRCPSCNFVLTVSTIDALSGNVGMTVDQALSRKVEICPNDGLPMVKVTWRERAADHFKWGNDLMIELIQLTGADHLPGALDKIRQTFK